MPPGIYGRLRNRLVLHHVLSEELLKKIIFEYAFVKANIEAGKKAKKVNSPVNPGSDAVVDGVDFSLKTEASSNINQSSITISKLSVFVGFPMGEIVE